MVPTAWLRGVMILAQVNCREKLPDTQYGKIGLEQHFPGFGKDISLKK